MNFSFISVVSLVVDDTDVVNQYLKNVHKVLKDNFSDYEIILVNNKSFKDIRVLTKGLEQDIKKDVTVINLSSHVQEDNAIFAGFDRANGDYAVFLEMKFYQTPGLVMDLYNKSQQNCDIVYIKHKHRELTFREKTLFGIYYWLLNRVADFKVDINMDKSRIISRRALNSLLKLRESVQYFKGLFSYVGYDSSFIEIDFKVTQKKGNLKGQLKFAFQTYLAFTDILNKLLFRIFIVSFLFSIGVSLDAILIKLRGIDIFGTAQHNTIPGWSFLIVTLSVMFTLVCLILYLMSLYLNQINKETKRRPIYLIESIQRL